MAAFERIPEKEGRIVKVGLVGAGNIGKTHLSAYRKVRGARVAAIAGRNREAGEQLAEEYACRHYPSLEAMLEQEEIDVVDICLPTHLHEQHAIQAARAGKHVLCEKPIALTLGAAERMLEEVRQANVAFMVAQVLRFWPEYIAIKQWIDEGKLGRPEMVYANRLSQPPDWSAWFRDAKKSGGALYDLHLHDIDYLIHLLGPVASVYAVGKQSENGAWDHVATNLLFASGSKAVVEGSHLMGKDFPFTVTMRVNGPLGTLDYSNTSDRVSGKREGHLAWYGEGGRQPVDVKAGDPFVNQLQYFVDCVKNGERPQIITPEESVQVLRVMTAIQRSLETGEVQRIDWMWRPGEMGKERECKE
ncbi:Gfo/Idh/MocA family protein [Brevibacillus borstelensis]|uniref:Gfo/Idh/MocA family protein n=1 Tax=Brevibacillus borstelensis TaxID=45462 RepID=UPI0030BA319C